MNFMKKLWAVLLLLVASGQVFADEGMWVLKELNKQNLARMKELGFTPSYEQLYSETDPCVANAVVIFGGGCSGITVSNEGLIFTNHHCGFGSIQQLSSVFLCRCSAKLILHIRIMYMFFLVINYETIIYYSYI